MEIKNQKGQTVVEYILLLAVAVSLVVTFYRSETFRKFFGTQGQLGKMYKKDSEFGFRHAHLKPSTDETNTPKNSAEQHASYWNQEKRETHFFGPKAGYQ